MNFFKQIFTWWNKQTIGTFIYTVMFGKFSGEDQFGNKYYSNSKGKRWVIYESNVESSKIPSEWHSWIHFMRTEKPSKDIKKFSVFVDKFSKPIFIEDAIPVSKSLLKINLIFLFFSIIFFTLSL